ncbi:MULTISPECIES: hypothetical protein [Henriciella]|jgi:hypothetical protein|uniref:hypothetical protein n=1 Tax=Henriciella TaxID=453849 RepID=UPI0011C39B5C|nr:MULTISPECIES: hypothetical protein [Henriciella]
MQSYYNPMQPSNSCASAWLDAARRLRDDGPQYGLILHIADPVAHSESDHELIAAVDEFLRAHKSFPISTVANTIFPEELYVPGDRQLLYDRYERQFPRIKKAVPDWGRYFHRMISWKKGRDGSTENQLETMIENLSKFGPARDDVINRYHMYELSLFHPVRDANKFRGRQCLSFIEIKPELDGEKVRLHMTALYRSHFYVAKTLGNLIGLGRLLNFIAREAGHEPGTLTIHSTFAELDTGITDSKRGSKAWNKSGTKELIADCEKIMSGARADTAA